MFGKKDDDSRKKLQEVIARQRKQEMRLNAIEIRLNYLKRLVDVQARVAG